MKSLIQRPWNIVAGIALAVVLSLGLVYAQSSGPSGGGVGSGTTGNVPGLTDPCLTPALKSSVPISVTSAITTSLVAVSAGKSVYVCGATFTIAPSATSADTAAFEYGTGAACTSPTLLTGTFGNGDLTTAAPPVMVTLSDPGTSMTAPASNGLCILSAGTTVNIQGVLQYVQQ